MKTRFNASAKWFVLVYSISLFVNQVNAQTPQLTVKQIASPVYCLGQSYYKFVIQASGGVVTVNKGIIVADTIKNVEAGITPLIVTLTAPNGQTIKDTMFLPTVDAFPPASALTPSYTVCKSNPLPTLSAFVTSSNVTVDWYDKPVGGTKVATGSLTYQPTNAKTYYALSRDISTGCVGLGRTPASIIVIEPVCVFVATTKIRI